MTDKLRPVGNMVLLSIPKKDTTESGLKLIGEVAHERFAKVLAMGEGVGEVAFDIGDRVIFKGGGAEFLELDEKAYVLCPPETVYAVIESGDVN